MFEGIFLEKEIKEKLSELKEIDEKMYGYLLNKKIEFKKSKVLKKSVEQTIKRYLLRVTGFEKASIKKYLSKFIEEYQKRLTAKELINRINLPSNKKIILYVASAPTFNIIRQSIYLRKAGYETILLMERSLSLINLAEKYFDIVYVFNSIYSLSYILKEARPYLVHVQGTTRNANHFGIIAKLLSKCKVIFNFYDIPSTTIAKEDIISAGKEIVSAGGAGGSIEEIELDFFSERFACERCDGIIYSYYPRVEDILMSRHRISSPMVEFHSYPCDEFMSSEIGKYSDNDGNIYIVYGGGVAPSHMPEKYFGDTKFHGLIDKITRQGIYFSIYTLTASQMLIKRDYGDYLRISEKNQYFKFMKGMPLHESTREFSKYDFGAMIYPFVSETLYWGTNMKEHIPMRLADKFFTYLESGLPIIISEELHYGARLVKEYEIGIVVSQKDFDKLSEIINGYDREKLKANVKRAREELSMKRNIGRLIEFYEQVVGNR